MLKSKLLKKALLLSGYAVFTTITTLGVTFYCLTE